MTYLLDTHTVIWFLSGDKLLSKPARKAIEDVNSTRFVSIGSLWEMAIKIKANKLFLDSSYAEMEQGLYDNGIQIMSISFQDTLTLLSLPLHHRDPFDRIIISQSMNNKLTVITKDEAFSLYKVKTLW